MKILKINVILYLRDFRVNKILFKTKKKKKKKKNTACLHSEMRKKLIPQKTRAMVARVHLQMGGKKFSKQHGPQWPVFT